VSTSELGKAVAIGDIDSELRAMFVEDAGMSRASLANLAVYNEDPDALTRNSEIVRQLTRNHACRSILIISEAGGERSAQAWVQAHCNLSKDGEKAICSEQVAFHLRGGGSNLVRNTVFAHLDSDLPLVFWWQGELSDVFEERLYSRIDRFIFDSRHWSRPETQFLRLSAAIHDQGAQFIPHDLSYTRGSQVRSAIMACFNEPRAREIIPHLNRVVVRHRSGHRMTALWIAAWIAGRLGCTLDQRSEIRAENTERYHFQRSSTGQLPLAIDLQLIDLSECATEPGEAAALAEVELHAGDAFHFAIERRADAEFWKLKIQHPGCQQAIEELIPARSCGDAALVNEVLSRAGRNRAMQDLLPLLRQLLSA
jgi:glucose-6-phosphate dehydrogenase assembly protein OpcA